MCKCKGILSVCDGFEVNYMNASLSEVSASLSEVIQCEVQYCKEAKV
jgi:hypothetical protein